ncbi:CDP-alcohol phosphatidyltransferase family protein [Aquisalimonas asiatica]|uniref:Phosphatidylglycerophosphate synthase n=1 Tax=Aquisalimonas asiatica TaxID=406100 RepID=A0A1H8TKU7_9GAMM|nr:CDP-alcohol phosphatidyltransferase family protein [Aquisalimonas asiatica]SEO91108.1 Phosphatidylglycerophosphate synthase [Aquisalimonas asiatica]
MYGFHAASPGGSVAGLPRLLALEVGVALALGLGVLVTVYAAGAITPQALLAAGGIAVGGAALLLERAVRRGMATGLGPANRVTLVRAVLCLPALGLVFHPQGVDEVARWWVVGLAAVVLVLDGVDGWVARRTGSSSAFGARFDMELDAVLLLALSVLVWYSGQVGAWVLLIGLMRYGFVAAGWLVPALNRPLPEAFRRKAACVVQGVVLVGCLVPLVPGTVATTAAAMALALLLWSFAADVCWLLSRRPCWRRDTP